MSYPALESFITNFLPGLRRGQRSQGMSPALKFPAFAEACYNFLNLQISLFSTARGFPIGQILCATINQMLKYPAELPK